MKRPARLVGWRSGERMPGFPVGARNKKPPLPNDWKEPGGSVCLKKCPSVSARVKTTGSVRGLMPLLAVPKVKEPKRSEEHTSELQSRLHLVCRLLLEKKKKYAKCLP